MRRRKRKKKKKEEKYVIHKDFLLRGVEGEIRGGVKDRVCFSGKLLSKDHSAFTSHCINVAMG